MLTGKRFRIERATLAVDGSGPKRRAITIPAGSIIQVISTRMDTRGIVDVLWEDRTFEMFAIDVEVRGAEITD